MAADARWIAHMTAIALVARIDRVLAENRADAVALSGMNGTFPFDPATVQKLVPGASPKLVSSFLLTEAFRRDLRIQTEERLVDVRPGMRVAGLRIFPRGELLEVRVRVRGDLAETARASAARTPTVHGPAAVEPLS